MSDLPPLTTEDKIVTTVVLVIFLLLTGAIWLGIFVLVWSFTGWKP